MTFELVGTGGNCVECEWTKAEGEITPETPAKFAQFKKENGHIGAVAPRRRQRPEKKGVALATPQTGAIRAGS